MADWKKLARSLALADGTIDEREVEALRQEIFADGRVDDEELAFLQDLKRSAGSAAPALDQLIADCEKSRGK